jgi:DNA invertase Pin-like site-specific DNA recombinase
LLNIIGSASFNTARVAFSAVMCRALAILDMLSVFAEFETNLRKERQLEGIAKAKAEGIYAKNGGRKATLDADKVKALHASGIGPAAIAKQLKMARSSVYRLLEPSDGVSRAAPAFTAAEGREPMFEFAEP